MRAARLQMDLDIMITRLIIADDHPVIRAGLRASAEQRWEGKVMEAS